jgi:MFS family permease
VVFLTTTLFTIPLAGFYPYAPPHLKELGLERMTAWMSLGQITEVIAMFALGGLILRWRLKWIIAAGLGFGVIRFVVSALDTRTGLIAGIVLHGCSFTLVNITAQIYLDQRVEPSWRGRAQALLSLMNGGFGNLLGYLGTGAWFAACSAGGKTQWSAFWLGLAVSVAGVLAVFLVAYRGRSSGLTPPPFARSG